MKLNNHISAPLYAALNTYSKKDIVHFDVPGHKKRYGPGLIEAFGNRLLSLDANSTKELDIVSKPIGAIREAEELMADAYDADYAFFLVNGSTSGVQYMIMAACNPGDKIILPRNVHKSAINGLILTGAVPVFIDTDVDDVFNISKTPTLAAIKEAMDQHPDAKAIYITYPSYFGIACDIQAIVDLAHERNMAVLADQAHGAHFPFHPDLPISASAAGADLATVSLHKTVGSLTQSSVLLLREGLIRKHDVRTIINLMQTTSASYILMASLDLARRDLVLHGFQRYDALLQEVNNIKKEIQALPGLDVLTGTSSDLVGSCSYDETKIVLKVSDLGLNGFEVYDLLYNEYGVQMELAESKIVLAVAGIGDDHQTLGRLLTALRKLSAKYANRPKRSVRTTFQAFEKPYSIMTPREAYYSSHSMVKIEDSAGRISGESVMIYPPGIPLIIPGEVITPEIIRHYLYYKSQGCIMVNDEYSPDVIKVLSTE